MPQVDVPLTREQALTLRIALLEQECALLQARLLGLEAQQRVEGLLHALLPRHPALPAHLGPFSLDLEGLCLRYEASDAEIPRVSSIPVDSARASGVD